MFVFKGVGTALHGVADGAGKLGHGASRLVPGKKKQGQNQPSFMKQSPFDSPSVQPQPRPDEETHFPVLLSSLNQLSSLTGGECASYGQCPRSKLHMTMCDCRRTVRDTHADAQKLKA